MACEGPDNMKLRKYRTPPGGKPGLSEDIRGVGNLRSASEDFTLLSVNENRNGVHGFRAASSESDLSRALRPNILLSQVEVILNDKAQYKRLLTQQGDLAQSILDLLQSIYDSPDTTLTLRSKTLSAMMHLSKKSGLYPNCLVLDNVTKIGEHPVAAGGFGEIWRGLIGGQMACLKVVKVYSNSDVQKLLKEFFKEAILWRQLDHPNVLPFLGLYFLDDSRQRVCLISPWMRNGNLRHFLSNNPDSSIDRARLAHDVACGIGYLHEKKIVHGDLKGENILITVAGRATIADFGLARKVAETNGLRLSFMSTASHPKGSARWMAPECLLQGAGPTYRSDVYAFACVCYEIFTGLFPFHELPQDVSVIFQLSAGKRPSRPPDRSQPNDSVWEIIQECWSQEPSARPVAGILPSKITTATHRVIEPADVWDGLLSSQLREVLRRTAQHVDLCPPGSQLQKFLFEFPPELLTHSVTIHDQDVPNIPNIPTESELEPIVLPNPHEKPLPSIPNMHNPAILTTFQTAMGGDVRRDWEWNDLVTNGIRKNLSENEATRQWFMFEFIKAEMSYSKDLESIETMVIRPLQNADPPIIPRYRLSQFVDLIFHNLVELHAHHKELVDMLHQIQREEHPLIRTISLAVSQAVVNFRDAYISYLRNRPIATYLFDDESQNNPAFETFLDKNQLNVREMIIGPSSHLVRFEQFLQTMLDSSPSDHEDRDIIPQIIETVKSMGTDMASNFTLRTRVLQYGSNIVFKPGEWMDMDLLSDHRNLIYCGGLWRPDGSDSNYLSEIFAFLFDNYFIMTRITRENGRTKYHVDEQPLPVDLLVPVSFSFPPLLYRKMLHDTPRSIYPCTVYCEGRKRDPYCTLYAGTAQARAEWKLKLEEALALREVTQVFRTQTLVSFLAPHPESLSWAGQYAFTKSVTCAVPFDTADGRCLVAIGCAEGVWAGLRNIPRSVKHVLYLKEVTQCAVLEDYNILLVLADELLLAYNTEVLDPLSVQISQPKRIPQKLSKEKGVNFFRIGKILGRTYVIYVKKKGINSLLQVVEPCRDSRRSPQNWFRDFKLMFLPFEACDLIFMQDKIVVIGPKAFNIVDLFDLRSVTIPDRRDPDNAPLNKRWEFVKPLGIFSSAKEEFLLCYTEFGIYVNESGKPTRQSRSILEWNGTVNNVAIYKPYFLLFSPCFIEVRHIQTGCLIQIIPGNNIRCVWDGIITISDDDSSRPDEQKKQICGVMTVTDSALPTPAQRVFGLVPRKLS